mgnify:CR=1 FL=1
MACLFDHVYGYVAPVLDKRAQGIFLQRPIHGRIQFTPHNNHPGAGRYFHIFQSEFLLLVFIDNGAFPYKRIIQFLMQSRALLRRWLLWIKAFLDKFSGFPGGDLLQNNMSQEWHAGECQREG